MSVYHHPDFNQHELVAFKQDQRSGLKAIIAIHNSKLGPALGGCRMYNYADENAALTDVLRLSRSMSYKAAMANVPLGGGKSVIIGDPHQDKSRELLLAMGDFIESQKGSYITAKDAGTSMDDLAVMAERTQYVSGVTKGAKHNGDPSVATACGVFIGMQTAVQHRLQSDLKGVRVALQGIGNVGYHLARHLMAAGAVVYSADVHQANIERAVQTLGVIEMPLEQILSADVDVLAPCALGGAINSESIEKLKAKVIAGGANNQLATVAMGDALLGRDILYAPDYVINAGGIIDIYYQSVDEYDVEAMRTQVEKIGSTLSMIFQRSKAEGISTAAVADLEAEKILL